MTLINDLLLVLIIMEVLGTIVSYLRARGFTLRPFLFIAVISSTRRILAVGAQMSIEGQTFNATQFRRAMIDLGVNAGVILVVAGALYLLSRAGEPEEPRGWVEAPPPGLPPAAGEGRR